MKKKLSKRTVTILGLLTTLTAGSLAWAYYFNPGLLDQNYIYHPVYNYETSEVKSQQKIIKDIQIELSVSQEQVHQMTDLDWNEEPITNPREIMKSYDTDGYLIKYPLHITFTDGSQADFQIEDTVNIGNGFSERTDERITTKLGYRFPDATASEPLIGENVMDFTLKLYPGDTLYQDSYSLFADLNKLTKFQIKNPKTNQLQTYYQYGTELKLTPFQKLYFKQSMKYSEEHQDFFDRYTQQYHPSENYYNREFDFYNSNQLNAKGDFYYKLFYSDAFTNLSTLISSTGSTFKTRVIFYYITGDNESGYKKYAAIKIYDETNKASYVNDVLNRY